MSAKPHTKPQAEPEATHIDLISTNPLSGGPTLIRRAQADDNDISEQVRSGWATYVAMSEPHTMSECPFKDSLSGDERRELTALQERVQQTQIESDEDNGGWRRIVEWDWVQIARSDDNADGSAGTADDDRLHAVVAISNDADADWYGVGTTECGIKSELYIPGIFTRMSAKRCEDCCGITGMPPGMQSPKNDETCRVVVESRLEALRAKRNP
jgi:hypothetical protein